MKKTTATLFAAFAVFGAATQANAQYQKPIGLSVRVGLFYPTNGDARDVEGEGWFAGGAEYKIKDLHFGDDSRYTSMLTASLDYYGKGSFSQVPLLLNYVAHRESFYWTAGAGIGFGRVPVTTGGSESDTEFAFQVGIGYDFVKSQMPLFLEMKYFGSSESKLSGFGVYGGIRF